MPKPKVELEMSHRQIDLMFAALAIAEGHFTTTGNFKVAQDLFTMRAKLLTELHQYTPVDVDD